MTTKLVVRLLDASGALLGWSEVQAVAKGDGKLWSRAAVAVVPSVSGMCVDISIHWCDVNVETRIQCRIPVQAGTALALYDRANPLIVVGPQAGGLPAVTVGRPVVVAMSAGQLGAKGGTL